MPLELLIASEVEQAQALSSQGEVPLLIATQYIPKAVIHHQLTLTEFPNSYRLLLVIDPVGQLPKRQSYADLQQTIKHIGEAKHDIALDVMHCIDASIKHINDPVNHRYIKHDRTWHRSPYSPEGCWQFVPPVHPHDYRVMSHREAPKPQTTFDYETEDYILHNIMTCVIGVLYPAMCGRNTLPDSLSSTFDLTSSSRPQHRSQRKGLSTEPTNLPLGWLSS